LIKRSTPSLKGIFNKLLDSVTETKITLQNYDAEFGKAVAGVVTAQTKSGSNQLHGTSYDYLRNDAFNAGRPLDNAEIERLLARLPSN